MIIKTYKCGHVTVHIADDAFRDASAAEIRRRKENMLEIAAGILYHDRLREEYGNGKENV